MASKKRISSDIDSNLAIALDAKANKLGISRAKLIEIALESELGRFNIHKENKRLTERKRRAEQETAELQHQLETAKAEHQDTRDLLESQKSLVENLKQIASYLGVPESVESQKSLVQHCKQRIDELQESIENRAKERDTFKFNFELAQSNYDIVCEKLRLLLTRNWWDRLWNVLPWMTDETLE